MATSEASKSSRGRPAGDYQVSPAPSDDLPPLDPTLALENLSSRRTRSPSVANGTVSALVDQHSAHVHGHAHSDQLDASDRDAETALGVLQEVILASALAARLTRRYRPGARTCRRAALHFRLAPRLAVAVVERAFLGIAEDGVRLGDLLEVLGCCEVLGFCGFDVRVRVEGARKLSVDGLYLFRRRVAPEAQYSVIVPLPHAPKIPWARGPRHRTRSRTSFSSHLGELSHRFDPRLLELFRIWVRRPPTARNCQTNGSIVHGRRLN